MLKTILTGFVLGIILILFIPATLILASWNAVPGDSTYSIKVGLEKAILGITPSDNLKTTLEIKYTERRFSEVEKLINTTPTTTTKDSNSKLINTSLENLTKQAVASKNSLQKIQNVEEKKIQTENLISTLQSISSKIEEKKQISNTISDSTKTPTKIPTKIPNIDSPLITNTPIPTSTRTPTPTPTLIPTNTPKPTENTQPIVNPPDFEDVQGIIDGIIDDLEEEVSTQSNFENDKNDNHSSSKKDNRESSDKNNSDKDKKDRKEH